MDWQRRGLIPSHERGKQHRYKIAEVRAAIDRIGLVEGQLVGVARRREQLARRAYERETGAYTCAQCGCGPFPASGFPPSALRSSTYQCRGCRNEQKRLARYRAGATPLSELQRRWTANKAERVVEKEKRITEAVARSAARSAARADYLRTSPTLPCRHCKVHKPREAFHPSVLDICKACFSDRDRRRFAEHSKNLTDHYVKRMLAKKTGLSMSTIPTVMIEAERVRLMIERALSKKGESPVDRVMNRTASGADNECWPWLGSTNTHGYGEIGIGARTLLVHRVVYETRFGPLLPATQVWRTCGNKLCLNPRHMELKSRGGPQ